MRLAHRIRDAVLEFLLRVSPPREISADELAAADFSTHPGGKGLRFTERLRQAFLRRWIRLRR